MSRDWLSVYVGILQRPKYRRLSIEARAALFHVWCLAGGQNPEATWPALDDLTDQVELDGWAANATAVLAELIERGWLDVDAEGRVLVHDWDDHQLAGTIASRRAYEADRKRDWRRQRRENALPPAPPSPVEREVTATVQMSPNVPESPGHVRDTPRGIVPSEGECRVCGGHLTDKELSRVGPGWIEHAEHPPEWATA
jgi:hypothetical protein